MCIEITLNAGAVLVIEAGATARPRVRIEHVGPVVPRPLVLGARAMDPFVLLDDQQTTLHAHDATDAAGNPVDLSSESIAWSVDDPSVLVLAPDGTSCGVVTTGKLGPAVVTCTAPGGASGTYAFMVGTDVAANINITADPPTSRMGAPQMAGVT